MQRCALHPANVLRGILVQRPLSHPLLRRTVPHPHSRPRPGGIAAYAHRKIDRLSWKGSLALVAGVFALVNFFPFYQEPPEDQSSEVSGSHFAPTVGTAVGYMHYLMESGYDEGEEQVYSAEEQRFVREVLEMIPGGALVINQPHDGSAFAYGLDGLNTYFRHIDTGGTPSRAGRYATT